jgi:hypothetical protein
MIGHKFVKVFMTKLINKLNYTVEVNAWQGCSQVFKLEWQRTNAASRNRMSEGQ